MATTKAPHCKDPSHLNVAVTPSQATGKVTATFIATMACHNDASYHAWGVVLSPKAKDPLSGLHLFPASVAWLPLQLRSKAGTCTGSQTVTISHTVLQKFMAFVSLSPSAALALADGIDAAAAKAPK
jgi:hypothetical protein